MCTRTLRTGRRCRSNDVAKQEPKQLQVDRLAVVLDSVLADGLPQVPDCCRGPVETKDLLVHGLDVLAVTLALLMTMVDDVREVINVLLDLVLQCFTQLFGIAVVPLLFTELGTLAFIARANDSSIVRILSSDLV